MTNTDAGDATGSAASDDYDTNNNTDPMTVVFFLFYLLLFAAVLLMGRALHQKPQLQKFLSEPALVLLVGMFVSFLIKVFVFHDEEEGDYADAAYDTNDDQNNSFKVNQDRFSNTVLSFSGEVFFIALLPPILFCSGYELKRELFFRHIKPIVAFAAIGTIVSGLMTALVLYGVQQMGWLGVVQPTLLELLTFGALIAATDTVSVLGVLQAKKVDPHLFSLVFGESALNDAVAIVLFRSFSHLVQFGVDDTKTALGEAALFVTGFMLEAIGSPLLGIVFSFLTALVFKHLDFAGTPTIELSLYILLMYIPFVLAEVCHLSGIVTIFFTGMFARRYIEPNVSEFTQRNAAVIFKLVAYLAETCIFLDLGLSVFGFSGSFHWQFIAFAFAAALVGRAASIFPISFLFNRSLQETTNEPLLPPISSTTTNTHGNNTVINNMGVVTSQQKDWKAMMNQSDDDDDDDDASSQFSSSTISSYSSSSHGLPGTKHRKRRRRQRRRRGRTTPEKRHDKVIPTKFMHVLWFAGLRGAVAYACARDFPDLYGNNDEVVAATMVIVLVTIIIMGGFSEPLLYMLNIRMDVNDEEYMKEWRLRRTLKGPIHEFERMYVYNVVVRDQSNTSGDKNQIVKDRSDSTAVEMTTKNMVQENGNDNPPQEHYHLTDAEGNVRSSQTTPTTVSSSASQGNLNVSSSSTTSNNKPIPKSLDIPPMA